MDNVTTLGLRLNAPRPVVNARNIYLFGEHLFPSWTILIRRDYFNTNNFQNHWIDASIFFCFSWLHFQIVFIVICFVGIKSNLLLLMIFNYRVQSVVYFVGVGEGDLTVNQFFSSSIWLCCLIITIDKTWSNLSNHDLIFFFFSKEVGWTGFKNRT